MNYKQKFLYTLLGAGFMAVGIIIGQWGTPDIEAQSDGVFDTIICRQLFVKNISDDMSGVYLSPTGVRITRGRDTAIELRSTEDQQNEVVIYSPRTGKRVAEIGSQWHMDNDREIAGVLIWDRRDANSISIAMLSSGETNGIDVMNPQTGKSAVAIKSDELRNYLAVYDYKNSNIQRDAFSFSSPSFDSSNIAMYYDRETDEIRVRNLED